MSINSVSSQSPTYWDELFASSASKKTQEEDNLAAKLFTDLDVDGNGEISLEESGLDQKTYDALDSDHDGVVSLTELETALELHRAAMVTQIKVNEQTEQEGGGQSVFDSLDTNQDGVVSAEELAAALNKQMEGMTTGTDSAGATQRSKNMLASLAGRLYDTISRAISGAEKQQTDLTV